MLEVNPGISIPDREIELRFIRASGPGGQNVNKVSSAVQLRFDVRASRSLPEVVKARLLELAAGRITGEGVLVINARRFRTQERNRADGLLRLAELVRAAAAPAAPARKKTRPTRAARRRRLESKRRHGEKKRRRGRVRSDDL